MNTRRGRKDGNNYKDAEDKETETDKQVMSEKKGRRVTPGRQSDH